MQEENIALLSLELSAGQFQSIIRSYINANNKYNNFKRTLVQNSTYIYVSILDINPSSSNSYYPTKRSCSNPQGWMLQGLERDVDCTPQTKAFFSDYQ